MSKTSAPDGNPERLHAFIEGVTSSDKQQRETTVNELFEAMRVDEVTVSQEHLDKLFRQARKYQDEEQFDDIVHAITSIAHFQPSEFNTIHIHQLGSYLKDQDRKKPSRLSVGIITAFQKIAESTDDGPDKVLPVSSIVFSFADCENTRIQEGVNVLSHYWNLQVHCQ